MPANELEEIVPCIKHSGINPTFARGNFPLGHEMFTWDKTHMTDWLRIRVEQRLEALGLGHIEAATAHGLERTYIRDIVDGKKNSVRPDGAAKLAVALGAPKEYFLFPEFQWSPPGEANAEAKATKEMQNVIPMKVANDLRVSDFFLPASESHDGSVRIPEYDIKLSAGGGRLAEDAHLKGVWELPGTFVNKMRSARNSLHMVEVIGDSMQPTLQPGDVIAIDQTDTNPAPPGIFALWDGYGLVVKRVQWVHGTNRVTLISDNPIYHPYEVVADDIKIFGRIKSVHRAM